MESEERSWRWQVMHSIIVAVVIVVLMAGLVAMHCLGDVSSGGQQGAVTQLPQPQTTGTVSIEQVLAQRRSIRSFTDQPLSQSEIGQLLWAAQGITAPERGFRAAPSAGALYPLELYVVTPEGVYHYQPQGHQVRLHRTGDQRPALAAACLGQGSVRQAAADFVITAVFSRTRAKYGERADQYVHNEVGAAGENLCLQAVGLELGSVMVGAFTDSQISEVLDLPADHAPLLVIPVGHPS